MDVLCQLKLALVTALAHLGLLKPHDREEREEEEGEEGEEGEVIPDPIIIMNGSSPSFVQVPVQTLMAMIKSRLPVVEYATFQERRGREGEGGGGCAVCLSSIEGRDEVRELSSCSHAFHRECLDRWVDYKQVTCPVCRSLLLPSKWERTVIPRFPGDEDDGI
ncbi:probable E3 ubiquitin-protein ligase RHA1A [Eucalyptus grandis]|uniref:probable E3 ubiquitin-protein ligase RHA1A n=1 Tax=Eucalyptus grandis TaxID=71139 RepID=UPI00192E9481|nr:probable E3 ubiquitin-protein ligase RHA1A [Eucalyptus grandis]